MKNKSNRIEHLVSFHVGNMLLNMFPDILVSVVKSEFAKDRRAINIFLSIFSDNKENIFKKIKNKAPTIRFNLAHKISLKKMPNIFFILDGGIEYSQKISDIMKEIREK
jgi:ribosome-binding factor A